LSRPAVRGETLEGRCGLVAIEGDPPDHARDEIVRRGQAQQECGLGHRFGRLHEHRARDLVRAHQRQERIGQEVAHQRRDARIVRAQPGVVAPGELPEVLVGVDALHGGRPRRAQMVTPPSTITAWPDTKRDSSLSR
jgi:hypothetical protein